MSSVTFDTQEALPDTAMGLVDIYRWNVNAFPRPHRDWW